MSLDDKGTQTAAADWIFAEGSICDYIVKRRPKTYANKAFEKSKQNTSSPIRKHKIFKTKNRCPDLQNETNVKETSQSETVVRVSKSTDTLTLRTDPKSAADSQVNLVPSGKVSQGTVTKPVNQLPAKPSWTSDSGYAKMPIPLIENPNPFSPIIKRVKKKKQTEKVTSGTEPRSQGDSSRILASENVTGDPSLKQSESKTSDASKSKVRTPTKKKQVKKDLGTDNSDEESDKKESSNSRNFLPKVLKCKICSRKFSTKKNLKNHSNVHLDEKPFKCETCGAGFSLKRTLVVHSRRHTGYRPFKCDVCDKTFIRSTDLTKHSRIHTGTKPFKCEICNRRFTLSSHLRAHNFTHSGNKPYKCDQCGEGFIYPSHLTRHMVGHTNDRPYKCEECAASFNRLDSLKKHMWKHETGKPYNCEHCKKIFSRPEYLKLHMRTHTEGKCKCPVCGEKYSCAGSLKRHEKLHLEDKVYQCSVCHQEFSRLYDWTKHSIIHTGVKPFQCMVCQKGFTIKGALTIHYRSHFK